MLTEELRRLGRLQKVDASIVELKRRFEAIDPGAAAKQLVDQARERFSQAEERLKSVRGELSDSELEQKRLEQKRESEQKKLYAGGIYNARDAEAIERETANLKERIAKLDERILELWEMVPPAQAELDEAKQKLAAAEENYAKYLEKYSKIQHEYEAKMASLNQERAKAVEDCDASLLLKYDIMREKKGGIGLAKVVGGQCSICHSSLSKIQLESVTLGRSLETCEGCGRYLYVE